MNSNQNSSQVSVVRRRQPAETLSESRVEMEARLTPLIRCVLRTGAGVPALVQWVRRTLPNLPPASAEQTAPRMARLLCAELLRQGHPDKIVGRMNTADTVVGT